MRQGKTVSQYSTNHPSAPDAFVARWIDTSLASDPPRARSLIVTVWGDALEPHGGVVWLAGLICLMASFGMNERLVRTSVFRLVKDGWLSGESYGRRSRYRLTTDGARRFEQAHHRIYAMPDPHWDSDWEIVLAPSDAGNAAARAKLRDDLAWGGFGVFGTGVYARPRHGDSVLPTILSALGLSSSALVLRGQDDASLGGVSLAASVHAAWNIAALAADYRRFLTRFGRVIDAFRARGALPGDPEQCFIVRTLLMHAFRRLLLRDPRLPPALLPLDWPGAAAFALCRDFYRLTHKRAEMHLAATLSLDGAPLPPANAQFYRRFGGLN
ncbi:MAG TPA: phenylacetic acid degradation operon negative regulatory protein PaaX [Casimicrobiaceae bacterium]